jgi:hypothetical protein
MEGEKRLELLTMRFAFEVVYSLLRRWKVRQLDQFSGKLHP